MTLVVVVVLPVRYVCSHLPLPLPVLDIIMTDLLA